jgi:hypothetical protein
MVKLTDENNPCSTSPFPIFPSWMHCSPGASPDALPHLRKQLSLSVRNRRAGENESAAQSSSGIYLKFHAHELPFPDARKFDNGSGSQGARQRIVLPPLLNPAELNRKIDLFQRKIDFRQFPVSPRAHSSGSKLFFSSPRFF